MAIDIEALVAPLSDEAPSGPDLSYEPERQEIESAFERSVSDGGGGDDDSFDWRKTIGLITEQATKTRDIWLPIYLMRAAAQSGNFELIAEATELLARLMEDRWEDVHPQLDDYGFIGRKSPCESLTRIADFIGPFTRIPLIEHPRLGRYNGADFERFADQGSKAENFGMFRALMDATDAEALQQVVDRLDAVRGALRRVDAVLTNNADGDTGTNFSPTYEALDKIRRAVAKNLPSVAETGGDVGSDSDSGQGSVSSGGGNSSSGPAFSGGINSRDDVVRALDAISAYYVRQEPSSPVPFALRRAREWISLDFMAVLQDIAPGSLDEAARVLKSGRSSSDSGDWGGAAAPEAEGDAWSSPSSDDGWSS